MKVEWRFWLRQLGRVKAVVNSRTKSDAALLDHATNRLLRSLKREMVKEAGHVDYKRLRKDGYSERLLARLRRA